MGRLDTVTNDRFQVSEFNDRFPAMNLKSGWSPGDPFLPVAFLQTDQESANWKATKQPLAATPNGRIIRATWRG